MAGMQSDQAGQVNNAMDMRVVITGLRLRLVKELKGAPISVLAVLVFYGDEPVTQDWLECQTGYTDKPIRQALSYLVGHGFVIQAGKGWIATDETKKMMGFAPWEDHKLELKVGQDEATESDSDRPNRNNSDSPIININKGLKDSNDSINNNSQDRENSDSTPQFSDFPELGKALIAVGIQENERTRRLLGRITPRDVRKMAAQIRDDPYHDLSETGLMVTILEGIAEKKERQGGYESWNS